MKNFDTLIKKAKQEGQEIQASNVINESLSEPFMQW